MDNGQCPNQAVQIVCELARYLPLLHNHAVTTAIEFIMQATPEFSSIAVHGDARSNANCAGLPEGTVSGTTFCVLGLQLAGGNDVLANAMKRLTVEGWKLVERQLDPDRRLVIVDAKGRSLPEIATLRGRINNGDFGAVNAISVSIPIVHRNNKD